MSEKEKEKEKQEKKPSKKSIKTLIKESSSSITTRRLIDNLKNRKRLRFRKRK